MRKYIVYLEDELRKDKFEFVFIHDEISLTNRIKRVIKTPEFLAYLMPKTVLEEYEIRYNSRDYHMLLDSRLENFSNVIRRALYDTGQRYNYGAVKITGYG